MITTEVRLPMGLLGFEKVKDYALVANPEVTVNRSISSDATPAVVNDSGVGLTMISSSGASTKKAPAVPATSAVSLKQTSVGKVLVDANGRTLYLFAADTANVSKLSAALHKLAAELREQGAA